MLSKLLKHEFKAMGRILLPLYAVTLIMSLVSGISTRLSSSFGSSVVHDYMNEKMPSAVAFLSNITAVLTVILFFILVFVAMVLCVVFSISRYKNNLHGQQGYLMHTLPVTAYENVVAKVIVAAAYQILAFITVIISILFFTSAAGGLNLIIAGGDIIDLLGHLSARTVFTILLALLNGIFGVVSFNTLIYASISIGHSFNGAKMLKSVGVFLLITIAESYLLSALDGIGSALDWSNNMNVDAALNISLAFGLVQSFLRILLFSWLSSYFIKNRLNLE